jgi:hypothetical protein
MAVENAVEAASGTELPEAATAETLLCEVEGCTEVGALRYFPRYRMRLCSRDYVAWADQERSDGRYW